MKQKVWFITGASKGFGLEIAKAALANGDKIVATVRKNPKEFAAALQRERQGTHRAIGCNERAGGEDRS